VQAFSSLSMYTPLWVLVILCRNPASGRGDTPPREVQTMFDAVGPVIRAARLPNGGVQTKADLIASINVISHQKAQLDCQSRHLKLLAGELGFRDYCYPHEADYIPGISEDAHRAKKRQRNLISDPIAEGGECDGSDGSDSHSQWKRPRTSGSGAGVGEHPSVKGGDSSTSSTRGHIESANSGDETAPPCTTEVPAQELFNPPTPRRRNLIPNISWFTRARHAAMIDEAKDGGLRKAGSRKGQPE